MPNLVNPYMYPTVIPPSGDFEIVVFDSLAMTAVNTPAVTIDGYDPLEGDVVVAWAASTSSATVNAIASGWVNVLGGTTSAGPGDGTVQVACVYHVVTAGEETANTNSWSLTNLWNTPETGEVIAMVVRGADTTTVLDSANSAVDATVAPTHVLAGLTGTNLSTGSLVLSAVFPDQFDTYAAAPTGWTSITASSATNQGGHVYRRDTLTLAGADVLPTNITPSAANEYASITIAILVAP
jgi:hypothetical protein